jgi:hypothetical protein
MVENEYGCHEFGATNMTSNAMLEETLFGQPQECPFHFKGVVLTIDLGMNQQNYTG